MHLLGDDQRRHRKNRSGSEKFFKRANTFIVAIQLACFLISISRISIAANKTFKGSMFFPKDFELEKVIANKTGNVNCSSSFNEQFFGFDEVNLTVTSKNRGYFFANLAYRLRYVVGANAATIVLGGANKLIMDFNKMEFVYHQLVFHKEIITLLEICLLAFNVYQLGVCEMWGSILRDFLESCGVDSETSIPYVVPLIEMYFSCIFALCCHTVTLIIHCVNASKKGGMTREGVAAMHAGVLELDPKIQYDDYGRAVFDGEGNPIHSGAQLAAAEDADAGFGLPQDDGWDEEEGGGGDEQEMYDVQQAPPQEGGGGGGNQMPRRQQ